MPSLRNPAPFLVALLVVCPSVAAAQTRYTSDMLRDLPSGGNLFALLEGAQAEITTDRFNSGGLNAGIPERMSAFLASWTQTFYRIGDVSISSAFDGTPLMFPRTSWFDSVDVSTWHTAFDSHGSGLTVSMQPPDFTDTWSGSIEATASGGSLSETTSTDRPPAIDELDHFSTVSGVIHGAAMDGRLHLLFGGSSAHAGTTARRTLRSERSTESFVARMKWDVSDSRSVQLFTWIEPGTAAHVQASLGSGERWRIFAGYTGATREFSAASSSLDRLYDGPVSERAAAVNRRERSWTVGARSARSLGAHALTYGFDVQRASVHALAFNGLIYESIDGAPARAWNYHPQDEESRRHALDASLFIADRVAIGSRLIGDLALRVSSAHGKAKDAAHGIDWNSVEPFWGLRWKIGTPLGLEAFVHASHTADRLRLNLLAAGDPHAEAADVFRWNGTSIGPLIARVGPGTNGDDAFSTIDPHVKRPGTNEIAFGASSQLLESFRMGVTFIARGQRPLVNIVNVGVPSSGYVMFTIPDPNGDLLGTQDDQQLPVYDRKPETFGADRYVLTNPSIDAADLGAVIVSGEWRRKEILLVASGTAAMGLAPGVNRGFNANENDQGLLGEAFSDPNAATYSRGQTFTDRAYTIKVMSIVNLPSHFTLGVAARYQDGQPFARVQIVKDLNQGAEMIQAFGRGRSRFTFRSTVDLRLQKRIGKIDLIAEAYNLINMSNEVEEYVVTGPRFRETTAVQPPRSFHLGARINF